MKSKEHRRGPLLAFLHSHSLSLAAFAILAGWTLLYARSDPSTHSGAFFGNSVADWSGTLFFVIGTKFLYETGSVESRRLPRHLQSPFLEFLYAHSLTIFLVVWAWLAVSLRIRRSQFEVGTGGRQRSL